MLKTMLRRVVDDDNLLRVLDRIVEHQPPGLPPGKGLPIGNLTSQHFANLYLGPLDRALCNRFGERRYLRYMDDFLIFGDSKAALHEARAKAVSNLAALSLELNERATLVAPVSEGIPFLGLRIFRCTVRLQHAVRSRFFRDRRRRLTELTAAQLDHEGFLCSEASVFSHLAHADTYGLRSRAMADRGLRA